MSATAATIRIAIEAQTATLKKGFADAKGSVDSLGASLSGKVAAGMAKFHIALAAVQGALASVKGAVASVFESMNRLANTADFANRIGIGVEQLQALRYAAEQNGSSANVMDMALQRLTRRVAQAAAGSGELKDILLELGLNAQELNAMSPDKKMMAFAEALKNAGTRGDQMRMAMAALDTEGVGLVDLLSKGAGELEMWGQRASEAGIASAEMTERAQKAMEAVKKWNAVWKNFKDILASYVLPVITKLLEGLTWLIDKLRWIFGWSGKTSPSPLAKTDELKAAFKPMTEASKAIKESAESAATPGISALSRTSAAAFSAIQAQRRQQDDERRRHMEQMEELARIRRAVEASGTVLAPVSI